MLKLNLKISLILLFLLSSCTHSNPIPDVPVVVRISDSTYYFKNTVSDKSGPVIDFNIDDYVFLSLESYRQIKSYMQKECAKYPKECVFSKAPNQ